MAIDACLALLAMQQQEQRRQGMLGWPSVPEGANVNGGGEDGDLVGCFYEFSLPRTHQAVSHLRLFIFY